MQITKNLNSLFFICGLLFATNTYAYCNNNSINDVSEKHGVTIHCDANYERYFSSKHILRKFCKDKISGNSVYFTYSSSRIISKGLDEVLSRYPKKVLEKHLHHIYLLSGFHCNGLPYGGTGFDDVIYLDVHDYTNRAWLVDAFHHEFSSVLMKENRWLFQMWRFERISGSESYNGSTLAEKCLSRKKNCRTYSSDFLRKGFIYEYGMTNPENDFNVYVEHFFNNPEKLKELREQYPLVDEKARHIELFYRKIGMII